MYAIGFGTFFIFFWLYKYFLISYYAKTDQALEPELVEDIFGYMKIILFLKLCVGFFIHCNTTMFGIDQGSYDAIIKFNLQTLLARWHKDIAKQYDNFAKTNGVLDLSHVHQ
jgi:hypothetical protein